MTKEQQEADWVLRLEQGDKEAVAEILEHYRPALYRELRKTYDTEVIRDAIQEVSENMLDKIEEEGKYEIKSTLRGFIFTAVKNECSHIFKRWSIKVTGTIEDDTYSGQSIEEALQFMSLWEKYLKLVNGKLKGLKPQCQKLFSTLALCKNNEDKDLYELLGITKGSANSVKSKCRKALEKLLGINI